jgi:hypothetical protein
LVTFGSLAIYTHFSMTTTLRRGVRRGETERVKNIRADPHSGLTKMKPSYGPIVAAQALV